jgi:hypothetical protein
MKYTKFCRLKDKQEAIAAFRMGKPVLVDMGMRTYLYDPETFEPESPDKGADSVMREIGRIQKRVDSYYIATREEENEQA